MIPITTEGSARAWVGACYGETVNDGAISATDVPATRLQKRPPGGRVGRCPAVPGGTVLCVGGDL